MPCIQKQTVDRRRSNDRPAVGHQWPQAGPWGNITLGIKTERVGTYCLQRSNARGIERAVIPFEIGEASYAPSRSN